MESFSLVLLHQTQHFNHHVSLFVKPLIQFVKSRVDSGDLVSSFVKSRVDSGDLVSSFVMSRVDLVSGFFKLFILFVKSRADSGDLDLRGTHHCMN